MSEVTAHDESEPRRRRRIPGLDLARGLAVFGMFVAHLGPEDGRGGVVGFALDAADGRASALFAVLTGITLIYITSRERTCGGTRTTVAVLVRAAILIALGLILSISGAPVKVILVFYGACFVLVLPLVRMSGRVLSVAAVAAVLAGPQLLFVARPWCESTSTAACELVVTGTYPALVWVSFILTGMALARMDLASTRIQFGLLWVGVGTAVLGYGGSWLAMDTVPGVDPLLRGSRLWWAFDSGNSEHWSWLLVAAPHSQTTLSVLGNTGVAVAIVATALLATAEHGMLTRALRPVTAVGAMSLTVYVAHIGAVWAIHATGIDTLAERSMVVLIGLTAGTTVAATIWMQRFRRGPLEAMLSSTTVRAQRLI
ncbi:hypothetical protein NN3_46460 [Nocardia neocaledoniensis NBRC 108232]|uniref:Uncharacterized protein DUF1624 n=1 Tax=Nocardia neocaledoniensis TaxID=236511 RepID=A0A317NAH0_9NOCA|nr:DUF418 domain-containing protein [Nocardia neocaledoniensis]PWV72316.1 uncharacterized protein DUF1624 [Nocardia neocaledoniensis]GEM33639.1 hypothetical protein NN3_46460 [Nocardia neocaledoniensis NBRC 108232]